MCMWHFHQCFCHVASASACWATPRLQPCRRPNGGQRRSCKGHWESCRWKWPATGPGSDVSSNWGIAKWPAHGTDNAPPAEDVDWEGALKPQGLKVTSTMDPLRIRMWYAQKTVIHSFPETTRGIKGLNSSVTLPLPRYHRANTKNQPVTKTQSDLKISGKFETGKGRAPKSSNPCEKKTEQNSKRSAVFFAKALVELEDDWMRIHFHYARGLQNSGHQTRENPCSFSRSCCRVSTLMQIKLQ